MATGRENYEPTGWAEELIPAAVAIDHPRLATLYVMASQCHVAGRVEDGARYCEQAEAILSRCPDALPYGMESYLGWAYLFVGRPDRWADACSAQIRRSANPSVFLRMGLVMALTFWR